LWRRLLTIQTPKLLTEIADISQSLASVRLFQSHE
jgi:hypothetical protein